jgi:hypothetical protein
MTDHKIYNVPVKMDSRVSRFWHFLKFLLIDLTRYERMMTFLIRRDDSRLASVFDHLSQHLNPSSEDRFDMAFSCAAYRVLILYRSTIHKNASLVTSEARHRTFFLLAATGGVARIRVY